MVEATFDDDVMKDGGRKAFMKGSQLTLSQGKVLSNVYWKD